MQKDPINQLLNLQKVYYLKNRKVTFSRIIPRKDQWNNKAEQVNSHLKEMYSSVDMDYIYHFKNFNPKRHLNNSKLHLNEKGSWKLKNVFVNYLSDLFK